MVINDIENRLLVYDIEANGLLDEVTKIWCLVAIDYDTNEVFLFHDYPQYDNFEGVDEKGNNFKVPKRTGSLKDGVLSIHKAKGIICHNQLGYDQPLISKFYPKFKQRYNYPEVRDTMLESQVQWFDRPPLKGYKGVHGLAVWGARLGIRKPEIEDWSYIDEGKLNRCIEDVKINVLTARYLEEERSRLLDTIGVDFTKALQEEHEYRYNCSIQEKNGALVDKPHMKRCVKDLTVIIDKLADEIAPQLPPTVKFASTKLTKTDLFEVLGITSKATNTEVYKEVDGVLQLVAVKEWLKPTTKWLNSKVQKYYGIYDGEVCINKCEFPKMKDAREYAKEILSSTKGIKYPYVEKEIESYNANTKIHFGETLNKIEIVGEFTKVKVIPSEMSQHGKIKELLVGLGWESDLWTFETDSNGNFERAVTSGEVVWPEFEVNGRQMRVEYKTGQPIPKTPKLDKDSYDSLPEGLGKKIGEYNTYSHRLKFIENPKKDEKGLLNNIRSDGRITCGIMTFGTTAGRASHSLWVNPPGAKALFGTEIRKIIIAPENHKLIGIDMPSAHPRLLADFTQNELFIKAVDGNEEDPVTGEYLGEDFHTVNSVLFSLNTQEEVNEARSTQDHDLIVKLAKGRGIGKGGSYACLPKDNTEVLTLDGWLKFKDLQEGMKILSMNPLTKEIEEDSVLKIHDKGLDKTVVIKDKHSLSLESTEDHRWLIEKRKFINNKRVTELEFRETSQLNTECSIVRNGDYVPKVHSHCSKEEAKLLGFILGDGCVSWSKKADKTSSSFGDKKGVKVVITQAESKYCNEIEKTCDLLDCLTKGRYTTKRGVNSPIRNYAIRADYFREYWKRLGFKKLDKDKIDLVKWVLSNPKENIIAFLDGFWLSDGWTGQRGVKLISQNRGNISDGVTLAAYLSGFTPSVHDKPSKNRHCAIRLRERSKTTLQRASIEDGRITDVFCITTNNSTFIIKQGDCISVTGNCLYGGSGKKIAQTIGMSESQGNQLKTDFLAGLGLDGLLAEIEKDWNKKRWSDYCNGDYKVTGNFISVLGGYEVFCTSKHKIINYKALGSEAVVQKVAINWVSKQIREKGLKSKLIISMHDECLFESPDEEVAIMKELAYNMYPSAAKILGLTLDWHSTPKVGINYAECH